MDATTMKRMKWDGGDWQPLNCTEPMLVEVTADLFDKRFTDAGIDELIAVMALTPQHTYLMATEHCERMAQYFADNGYAPAPGGPMRDRMKIAARRLRPRWTEEVDYTNDVWPLPNLWLGLTVRTQADLDEQAKHLLECPASVRWLDVRPREGMDLVYREYDEEGIYLVYPMKGKRVYWRDDRAFNIADHEDPCERIHWVRVTCESGPVHPNWLRTIRNQCADAGVPFCFEGWGEWVGGLDFLSDTDDDAGPAGEYAELQNGETARSGAFDPESWHCWVDDESRGINDPVSVRVGADKSGRLLDGREHNDMPERKDG